MKPKLYDTSFGKNELSNSASNQNYSPLNYHHHHFKFRYLSENVQSKSIDKTMEPIDLSLKRTSPELSSRTLDQNSKDDKQINNHKSNEAKLLPYLLSNQVTNKTSENQVTNQAKNQQIEESFADVDLLKYNKKKLFLASVRKRKQSSSTDNSTASLSPSSLSNSPNSTPSSSHTTHQPLTNSDRRNSSSSTTSSTNLALSPNSDLNYDLDNNLQTIKEFNLRNKLFDGNDLSFNSKFEYFSKNYKQIELIASKSEENPMQNGSTKQTNSYNDRRTKQANSSSKLVNNDSPVNDVKLINGNHNKLKFIDESIQKCNNSKKFINIGLKRSRSELDFTDRKRENFLNLLAYKHKLTKKWRSESDLAELIKIYRCNQNEPTTKQNEQTDKKMNNRSNGDQKNENLNGQLIKEESNKEKFKKQMNGSSIDYSRERKEKELKFYENEIKKQIYLRNHTKEEDLMNYTKHLIRSDQTEFYPFSQFDQFDEFDKFNQMKSSTLPLNLQLNRSKASLTFNNSQFLNNKKTLINGQCKLNEKTGKRKFTKLASDEDEEDLDDEEENEENIIVDNLSNTASSSVSPSSIQSNSDSSLINKQLLVKHHHLDRHIGHLTNHHLDRHHLDRHHLDRHIGHLTNHPLDRHHLETHSENGGLDLRLDLRLPFLNHHTSPHLVSNHLNNLSRRNLPNIKQSKFGNLPTDLLSNDLLPNETSSLNSNSKDHLTSWKLYKDYYLLLNQPDSPAKLNAIQWIMKDLNEKNNNHISLNENWSEQDLIKLHSYKQPYSIETNSPLNLTMFNNLNRSNNSTVFDHRQSLSTNRLDRQKFATNSPQPLNLGGMQLNPENYFQYVKMNENLIASNLHLNQPNQLQILTGQNYLNLENGNNHCLPPGTPNSFQDRKRISRPLTGRHVRQGTGASPTTLANLRSMIKERQKFRELNGSTGINGKKFRKKRK